MEWREESVIAPFQSSFLLNTGTIVLFPLRKYVRQNNKYEPITNQKSTTEYFVKIKVKIYTTLH